MINSLQEWIRKCKENFNNIMNVLKMVHKMRRSVLSLIAGKSLLQSINPFIAIILSSMIIDELTTGKPVNSILQLAGIGVGVIFLLNITISIFGKYSSIQINYCYRLFDTKIGEKTMEMDYTQLENTKTHELRQKIQDDTNWGSGLFTVFWSFEQTTKTIFSLLISMIIMIPLFQITTVRNNFNLTMMFFAFILMITVLTLFFQLFTGKQMFSMMDNMTKQTRLMWYFLFGGLDYKAGKDIRIYRAQNLITDHMDSDGARHRVKSVSEISKISGLGRGVGAATSGLIEGGAYLFVALRAAAGDLSIGAVVKYAGSIHQFASALSGIILCLTNFAISAGRLSSSIDFFNIPGILYKGSLPVEKRNDNEYEIEFKNVSFIYPGADCPALKNLSLTLKIGERLAVVGMNGSGKTTFIKLLCRLYDPSEGEILLNGINIQKYDYNEYMSIFSVVFQDFKLFSFSLGQNVAASVVYDKEKAIASLKQAGMGERLQTMQKGLDTPLYKDFEDDGVEISGGEAQKIALARALYKDAPFIVLDEPTASLDPIAEFEIYSKFNEIVGTKTAIYISHRLSSCRFCDDIAVFHEGQIIQRGNHEELVKDNLGKYYELWNAQAQYYNETDVENGRNEDIPEMN